MGEKCYYWEMKGAPLRLELGPRDLVDNRFCLVARDMLEKDQKMMFDITDVETKIIEQLEEYKKRLSQRALEYHNDHMKTCATMQEVNDIITLKGGFARIPFFGIDEGAKEAEEEIKNLCGAEIRGWDPYEE